MHFDGRLRDIRDVDSISEAHSDDRERGRGQEAVDIQEGMPVLP